MSSPEQIDFLKRTSFVYLLLRSSIAFLFVVFSLLVAFTVVFLALFISISYPFYAPSRCKIVSSSVDIRSAKVCELGLLNHTLKHVFYPSAKKKFRCRYDYYWASVFEVEYTDRSGYSHTAFAEAPSEALPHDCRPTFDAAWMAKDTFQVNETYDCWYALGISKLNLYYDEYFDCQSDRPSTMEMLERYLIMSTEMLMSWFSHIRQGELMYLSLEVIDGAATGILVSLIPMALSRMLYLLKSHIDNMGWARDANLVRLKQACFVACFCFVSWLALQYRRYSLLDIIHALT
ncbi:hypothetical protein Hdeb2414_s0698g00936841 [Helianthus debilis subsp. tardiflorus]